jgi:hypothetical protein
MAVPAPGQLERGETGHGTLKPRVACGQHSWWQAAAEIRAPGYDPFSPDGANDNLLISYEAVGPVSGSVPHPAYLCQIRLVT